MISKFVRLAALCALVCCTTAASAQAPTTAPVDTTSLDLPRVFLDCQAEGCDGDFFRTELTWLNFVRDRNLALVHIIATDRSTGSGGDEITITFIGQGSLSSRVDTVVVFAPQSSTEDESRRLVMRTIAQGMLRFVRELPLASRLSVMYRPPTGAAGDRVSETRGARDKWNLWVFRLSAGGYTSGDENYKNTNLNSSFRASRVTERWKAIFNSNVSYNENHYALSDTENLVTYRHNYGIETMVVKALDPHWSLGLQGHVSSSVVQNLDIGYRVGPAVEFDVFPYSESTRRQVIVRYGPGIKSINYEQPTVFDKMKEVKLDHRLIVAAEMTQPWGNLGTDIQFNQYLDTPGQRSFEFGAYVSWRIMTGLNINMDGGYSKTNDQINLKRGDLTPEEILLQLRQLRSGYSWWGSINLSYTFGSIFSNVVNPRFSRNTGGFFF